MNKSTESEFQLFKDGKFNTNFPAYYNLITGYCIRPKTENKNPIYDDIKIVTD